MKFYPGNFIRASTENGLRWTSLEASERSYSSGTPKLFSFILEPISWLSCPSPTQGMPPRRVQRKCLRLGVQTLALPLTSCIFLD